MPQDMARTITQSEYEALWEEAHDRGEVEWQINDFECSRSLPKALGQGEIRQFDLELGLNLCIDRVQYWRPVQLDYFCIKGDVLLSNFYLAGDRRMINPGIEIEADREETAGEACLCYIQEAQSIEYFPAETPLHSLSIAISLDRVRSFGLNVRNNTSILTSLLSDKKPHSFHQSLHQNSCQIQPIIHNIFNCPYQGTVKRIYLESKVLELLALQFYQLSETPKSDSIRKHLRPEDIERLYLAREILQQNFSAPPSLLSLARKVSLNDCKLKQGFRELFGTTVFGYLQQYRMEQAKSLLENPTLSITEIAHQVGYASPSRFCHAFKKYSGFPPSLYRSRRT